MRKGLTNESAEKRDTRIRCMNVFQHQRLAMDSSQERTERPVEQRHACSRK